MLNQPLRYTQYCFRHDSIQKKLFSEEGSILFSWEETATPLYHGTRDLQLAHLVGVVNVADQVDHTGAERIYKG